MKNLFRFTLIKMIMTILILQTTIALAQAPSIDWAQAYGGSENDYGYHIKQTPDGGYMVVGSSNSNDFDVGNNYGNHDAWAVKVDASGSIEWEQNYGGSDFDRIMDFVILENNEGYVFLAQTNSNDGDLPSATHSNTKTWLFQTDLNGTITSDIVIGSVSGDYIAASLIQAPDGDFVFSAYVFENIWMTKIHNSLNFIVWQDFHGGTNIDAPSKIRQTNDGGYIIIGYSGSNDIDVGGNYGEYDVWVVKTNEFGVIEWEQNYGGSDFDYGMDIIQTADGGYIFTANTASNDHDVNINYGEQDFWVVKINEFGTLEWEQNFGGSNSDQSTAILETPSGNYIVSGITNSNNGDVSGSIAGIDYWVIEVDPSGNLLWQKPMGGTGDDISWTSVLSNDGGVLLAGQTNSNNVNVSGNHGGVDFWVVKLESTLGTVQNILSEVVFYPNPVNDKLYLSSNNPMESIEIYNLAGQVFPVTPLFFEEGLGARIDFSGFANGVYIIKTTINSNTGTYKVIKH